MARYTLYLVVHNNKPGPNQIVLATGLARASLLTILRRRDPDYLPGLVVEEWCPDKDEDGRQLWRLAKEMDAAEWLAANGGK